MLFCVRNLNSCLTWGSCVGFNVMMPCCGLSLCPCPCYSVLPSGGECDCWDITERLYQGSLQQHSALTLTALGPTPYPQILSQPMCLGPHLSGSYTHYTDAIKWTLCRVLTSCRRKRRRANPKEIYTTYRQLQTVAHDEWCHPAQFNNFFIECWRVYQKSMRLHCSWSRQRSSLHSSNTITIYTIKPL